MDDLDKLIATAAEAYRVALAAGAALEAARRADDLADKAYRAARAEVSEHVNRRLEAACQNQGKPA
jgi:hypothetical protein